MLSALPRLAIDALGFVAAVFVLLSYAQRGARPMRRFAIFANGAFISYGVLAGAFPVLALHLVLLPVNLLRYAELPRDRPRATSAARALRSAIEFHSPRVRVGPP